MAQPVTKWLGANGILYDTEAEADQSLAERDDLRRLNSWLLQHIEFEGIGLEPEEIAVAVLRGFNITPRTT